MTEGKKINKIAIRKRSSKWTSEKLYTPNRKIKKIKQQMDSKTKNKTILFFNNCFNLPPSKLCYLMYILKLSSKFTILFSDFG